MVSKLSTILSTLANGAECNIKHTHHTQLDLRVEHVNSNCSTAFCGTFQEVTHRGKAHCVFFFLLEVLHPCAQAVGAQTCFSSLLSWVQHCLSTKEDTAALVKNRCWVSTNNSDYFRWRAAVPATFMGLAFSFPRHNKLCGFLVSLLGFLLFHSF